MIKSLLTKIKIVFFGKKAKSKNSTGILYDGNYLVLSGRVDAGDPIYLKK